MKNSNIHRYRFWLVWSVCLAYFGLVTSCNPENNFRQNIEIILQIPYHVQDGLKSANSIAGISRVTLTVTSGNKILDEIDLTISGNSATGTVKISPGENIKFSAVAVDENNIIQWHGSTTVDVVDDMTVGIELASIPPPPANLQASFAEGAVNLSWSQNNDPDFARYDLYRSQSENILGTVIHSATLFTETEFRDINISEGTNYFYTLVVSDTEKFTTKSNQESIRVPFVPPPPSELYVDSISNIVMLSWTKNTAPDFARYDLYRSQSESESSLGIIIHSATDITETEFIDSSVLEGNKYYYTVLVLDLDGFNSKSNREPAVIPNFPPSASILNGYYEGGYVYLNWTQNSDSDFARYELYRSQSKDSRGDVIHSTTINSETEFIDKMVSEGNTYFYTLVVFDASGLSTPSAIMITIDLPVNPPTPPTLRGTLDSCMVYLSWTENPDSNFDRYELYRYTSKNKLATKIFSTFFVAETKFTDSDKSLCSFLLEGGTLYYTLVVFNKDELSSNSDVVSIGF